LERNKAPQRLGMTRDAAKLTVFYAWQSDIRPPSHGSSLIRRALKDAAVRAEEQLGDPVRIEIDEATRNEPGSPDISTTIFRTIATADIFVGDVSIVNGSTSEGCATPNPNVLIELGYARALLGWARVIMLANESYGAVEEMPFDIDRRRISTFKCPPPAENAANDKAMLSSAKGQLRTLLCEAIVEIVKRSPARPVVPRLDDTTIKRERDVATLRSFMLCLNPDIIDSMAYNAPARLEQRMFPGCAILRP
jgi:hypothetical protein